MATVVGVMDRAGWSENTDILVIVDPDAERLLWVPRDLWCAGLHERVNRAFSIGGHGALRDALAEHGFVVQHSLCIGRAAAEHVLDGVEVEVPVASEQRCWYPLTPMAPIEDGRKLVCFRPPAETLRGERLHQWIGARHGAGQWRSDLDRIANQQTLLRCGWGALDFGRVLERPAELSRSGPEVWDELRAARPTWTFATFTEVTSRRIEGKNVLLDLRDVSRVRRGSWRLAQHLHGLRRRLAPAGSAAATRRPTVPA